MTSKERVFKTVNHEQPDRPPVFATLTPQVATALEKHLGMPESPPFDSLLSTRISHMELLTRLGNDCVGVAACSPKNYPTRVEADGTIVNEWGMRFKDAGLYNEFCGFPLANIQSADELDDYPWPDPDAEGRFDAAQEAVNRYGKDYAIVGDLECAMFETAWYLVGLEKFLMDLTMEKAYTYELLDRIAEINTRIGVKMIELGVDIIWAGDDFGTQKGMMLSPVLWSEVFKPRIAWMFETFRKANPEIKIAWHSCGSIVPIISDFIELGLDILNPIQPQAEGMDASFLKHTYGEDLTFFGGIDVQDLLPFGTVEEVKKVVKEKIEILGKGGGYILAPAHNIQPDTPLENIFAMYEAVRESAID